MVIKLEVFSERQNIVKAEVSIPSLAQHCHGRRTRSVRGTKVKDLNGSCTLSNLLYREVSTRKLN